MADNDTILYTNATWNTEKAYPVIRKIPYKHLLLYMKGQLTFDDVFITKISGWQLTALDYREFLYSVGLGHAEGVDDSDIRSKEKRVGYGVPILVPVEGNKIISFLENEITEHNSEYTKDWLLGLDEDPSHDVDPDMECFVLMFANKEPNPTRIRTDSAKKKSEQPFVGHRRFHGQMEVILQQGRVALMESITPPKTTGWAGSNPGFQGPGPDGPYGPTPLSETTINLLFENMQLKLERALQEMVEDLESRNDLK